MEGSIDINNVEDKTDDQSDSKREDLKNARNETENKLNSKSLAQTQGNVINEDKKNLNDPKIYKILKMEKENINEMCCRRTNTPTIDVEMDNMVSVYLNMTNNVSHKVDEGDI